MSPLADHLGCRGGSPARSGLLAGWLGLFLLLVACHGSSGGAVTPDTGGKPGDPGFKQPGDPGIAPQDYSLRFRRQPDDGLAGLTFDQAVEVAVVDDQGNLVDVDIRIEIHLDGATAGQTLGGTRVIKSEHGVASFVDLVVRLAGQDFSLVAASDSANPVTSVSFKRDVSAGKRHVILLIADGWGFKHIEARRSFTGKAGVFESLSLLPMSTWDSNVKLVNGAKPYDPSKAWSSLAYLVSAVTDSASSATVMYTGVKTNSGRVGVAPGIGGQRLTSIGELALRNGLGSGAVSSVPINHATPAAWAAHNDSRGAYGSIADEMLFGDPAATSSGSGGHGVVDVLPQVLIGGGHPDKSGGWYVSAAQLEKAKKESGNPGGWQVVERQTGKNGGEALLRVAGDARTERMFGLFGSGTGNIAFRLHDGSGIDAEEPTLAEMARGALQVLSRRPKGFCLMVEGGAIDWAGHGNDMSRMVGEMIGFDQMVKEVLDWVDDPSNDSNWRNTLLIVTGDHETGLLTAGPGLFPDLPLGKVTDRRIKDEQIDLLSGTTASWDDTNGDQMIDPGETVHWAWNTGGHSNSLIPCYFKGIESGEFAKRIDGVDPKRGRFIDNSALFPVMMRVLQR